jgi:hypothetical protein
MRWRQAKKQLSKIPCHDCNPNFPGVWYGYTEPIKLPAVRQMLKFDRKHGICSTCADRGSCPEHAKHEGGSKDEV